MLQIKLFINDKEQDALDHSLTTTENNDNCDLEKILSIRYSLICDLYIKNFDNTLIKTDPKSKKWINRPIERITESTCNIYIENADYSSTAFYFLCIFSAKNNVNIFIRDESLPPADTFIKSEYKKYQAKTLSSVEKEYLKNIATLEQKVKKGGKKGAI